jgi:hypothetical protein
VEITPLMSFKHLKMLNSASKCLKIKWQLKLLNFRNQKEKNSPKNSSHDAGGKWNPDSGKNSNHRFHPFMVQHNLTNRLPQRRSKTQPHHLQPMYSAWGWEFTMTSRASDTGRIGVFYAFKMPKMHWRWCRGLEIRLQKKKMLIPWAQ